MFLSPATLSICTREVRGEGEPLVFLHGFMGCGANWRLVFRNRQLASV